MTWRLVRMMPLALSTMKPVAYAELAGSVSTARVSVTLLHRAHGVRSRRKVRRLGSAGVRGVVARTGWAGGGGGACTCGGKPGGSQRFCDRTACGRLWRWVLGAGVRSSFGPAAARWRAAGRRIAGAWPHRGGDPGGCCGRWTRRRGTAAACRLPAAARRARRRGSWFETGASLCARSTWGPSTTR